MPGASPAARRARPGRPSRPTGDVYFTSARPDPDSPEGDPVNALWLLPADGGEARVVLSRAGGVSPVMAARSADATFVTAEILAGSADEEDDAERRKDPQGQQGFRHPAQRLPGALLGCRPRPRPAADLRRGSRARRRNPASRRRWTPRRRCKLRNLTPDAGPPAPRRRYGGQPRRQDHLHKLHQAARQGGQPLRPGGQWTSPPPRQKVLLDHEGMSYFPGPVSPDGRTLVVFSEIRFHPAPGAAGQAPPPRRFSSPAEPAGRGLTPLAHDWDRWAIAGHVAAGRFRSPGHGGRRRRVPGFPDQVPGVCGGSAEVTRVTQDAAAYTDVVVSPEGRPPTRCGAPTNFRRKRSGSTSGRVKPPGCPLRPNGPASRERSSASRQPRRTVPGCPPTWPCRKAPRRQNPAPLLLWIHGGPLGSWNAWTWRWNPWLLTAKGYAVLLPDPALSTGYGQALHPARLGRVGQGAVHGPDGRHGCRRGTAGHRRDPDGCDGRILRRLHGQLGGRPDRPLQRDRHPCQPVGPGPVRPHHGRLTVLAEGNDRGDGPGRTRRTCTSRRSARPCW